jgi:ribosomal 50S subunit-associated protein YjgA (DUF615 family)
MTFDQEDVYVLKSLFKRMESLEQLSVAFTKYFLSRISLDESRKALAAALTENSDPEAAQRSKSLVAELEKKITDSFFSDAGKLRDVIAKLESGHEQMEALLAQLDKVFPDPPPRGHPLPPAS